MIGLVAIFCVVLLGVAGNANAGVVERGSVRADSEGKGKAPGLAQLRVTMALKDLFDPQRGLYSNPTNRGEAWERPASAELIDRDGRPVFRANCGLRIHGGESRRPQTSPKHSFRLLFKAEYGTKELRFPIFGPGGAQRFRTLVLRAGYNDSWLNPDMRSRSRLGYVRDEWMRQSMAAMGYPSARGMFVELYLNDRYWGIYNLCERPDASFVAANEGGSAKDYDCRKGSEILSGDDAAWQKLMALGQTGMDDHQAFENMGRWVDLTAFADYMILNFYAGNRDWDRDSNWYAARRRTDTGKFKFFVWDAECTLGEIDDCTIDLTDEASPPGLFHQLSYNPDFRRLFAQRVERLLLNAGPLSAEANRARYQALAQRVEPAIGRETTRWGSEGGADRPQKFDHDECSIQTQRWQTEVERLLNNYFSHRTEVVLKQFRDRGLYPADSSPSVQ
jgi:hypothetical protein